MITEEDRQALIRAARKLGVHPHQVEDLVNEVLATAISQMADFDPAKGTFLAWSYGILRYAARRVRQRALRERAATVFSETGSVEIPDEKPSPLRDAVVREALGIVKQALETLSTQDQTIIVMCAIDELPISVAADLFGIPRNIVSVRLNRARMRLREACEHFMREP